jgi:ABC-type transporter Mla subunit MlaD
MSTDKSEKLDVIADSLDDLKTTVDELQDVMATPEETDTLARLRRALDDASEAADGLENLDKS